VSNEQSKEGLGQKNSKFRFIDSDLLAFLSFIFCSWNLKGKGRLFKSNVFGIQRGESLSSLSYIVPFLKLKKSHEDKGNDILHLLFLINILLFL
jgi:hypothetical protein